MSDLKYVLSLAVLCAGFSGGAFPAGAAEPQECRQGYVWRSAAPGDHVCVTPESRQRARNDNAAAADRRAPSAEFGPMACRQGFVWRSAFQGDMVCVTSQVRDETKRENELAASRVAAAPGPGVPKKGPVVVKPPQPDLAYGPDTCKQGYVWREAAPGDNVCVSPESRKRVKAENAAAESRRAKNSQYGPYGCVQGYVWRSAFQGDMVCVTPDIRDLVKRENSQAAATRVRG